MSWQSELKDIHARLEAIKAQDEVKRVIDIINWRHKGGTESIEVTPSIYSVWKELDPEFDDRGYNHPPRGIPKDFAGFNINTIPEAAKKSFDLMALLVPIGFKPYYNSLFDFLFGQAMDDPNYDFDELDFVHSTPQFEEIAKQFWATYNEGRRKEAVKLLPDLKEAAKNAFMQELCMEVPMTKFAGKE